MTDKPAVKNFIMLVGVPASGKSTFAVATFPEHVILSTDHIIDTLAYQLDTPAKSMVKDIIKPTQKLIDAQLELASYAMEDIVLDQAHITIKDRARQLKLLNNKDKYKKTALVFDTPESLLKLRLTKRDEDDKINIRAMLNKFEMPTVDEGFDEIKVLVA